MATTPRTVLPPAIQQALDQGDLMTAIRLLRNGGVGLKEAKDMLEAHMKGKPPPVAPEAMRASVQPPGSPDGLSPGQVPSSSGTFWWVVIVGLLALAVYFAVRRFG